MKNTNEEELIINNQKLINKCLIDLHCYYKTEDEYQNLYDAGLVGLINGVRSYNHNISKISTWLYKCIRNEICKEIYSSEKHKRRINKELMVSLDTEISDDTGTTYKDFVVDPNINVEEDVEKRLEIERLIYAIDLVLRPREKKLLCQKYGLNGYRVYSIKELIEQEKVSSHQRIYLIIKNAKKKLKMYLEKNQKEVFIIGNKNTEDIKVYRDYRVINGLKRCINCNKIKPVEEYNFKTENGKYRKSYCKVCEQKHDEMLKESLFKII